MLKQIEEMDVLGGYFTRKPSINLAKSFVLTFLQDKIRETYIPVQNVHCLVEGHPNISWENICLFLTLISQHNSLN